MLVINSAFEIIPENAGVKFFSFHITFQLVGKLYFHSIKSKNKFAMCKIKINDYKQILSSQIQLFL